MKTAMHQMLYELMAHEYIIPLDLIVKCVELIDMEKMQILNAMDTGFNDGYRFPKDIRFESSVQYYNQTYGGK